MEHIFSYKPKRGFYEQFQSSKSGKSTGLHSLVCLYLSLVDTKFLCEASKKQSIKGFDSLIGRLGIQIKLVNAILKTG